MSFIDTDFSFTNLVPELSPLLLVDVGAAPLARPTCYQRLLDGGKAAVIGFEPDEKSCAALNAQLRSPSRCYPVFIGRGGRATFYETNTNYTSSLYRPNIEILNRFTGLMDHTTLIRTHEVKTARLDDIIPEAEIDFMKMDVQGAELDVLHGAARLLPTMLAVQTEVEFVPLYENQPLFADIDKHMRAQGFQLHALIDQNRMFYTPVSDTERPLSGLNQLIYADAVYVPDLSSLHRFPAARLLKLVTILHDFYQSYDLCLHILAILRRQGAEVPYESYMRRLDAAPGKS